MNLQDLVPPLALCRAIPKGEFKDTYFSYSWCSFRNEYIICKTEWKHPKLSFPAPTLQEILEDLPTIFDLHSFWDESEPTRSYFITLDIKFGEKAKTTIECAMKIWLKYKGIK